MRQGIIERADGVRIGYEVHGDGEPTILLLPAWSIVPSGVWKMQVPFLARHHRVVVFDPPGNGRSDRPADRAAYLGRAIVGDALAVLDTTATHDVVIAGLSCGVPRALAIAAARPEQVRGLVLIAPAVPGLVPPLPART